MKTIRQIDAKTLDASIISPEAMELGSDLGCRFENVATAQEMKETILEIAYLIEITMRPEKDPNP